MNKHNPTDKIALWTKSPPAKHNIYKSQDSAYLSGTRDLCNAYLTSATTTHQCTTDTDSVFLVDTENTGLIGMNNTLETCGVTMN